MPHINVKHFSPLSKMQQSELVVGLTEIVSRIMQCDEGVITIAIEPIEKERWNEQVYIPEIINRKELLHKLPSY